MTKNTPTVKIIVATHKKYEMPQDAMYLPLHVGAEGKTDQNGNPLDLGYQKDNTGENISNKNAAYCELTGLYWAWKNLDTDYTGLAHYRRHFGKKTKAPFEGVLTYNELRPMLEKYKIFVPKKRKYYIETLYSHYEHTHYASQLDITREIIAEKYPDYLKSYDEVVKHTYGYMFNIVSFCWCIGVILYKGLDQYHVLGDPLYYLLWFYLGYRLENMIEWLKKHNIWKDSSILCLFGLVCLSFIVDKIVKIHFFHFLSSYIVCPFFMLIVLNYIVRHIKINGRAIKSLSDYGMGIYLYAEPLNYLFLFWFYRFCGIEFFGSEFGAAIIYFSRIVITPIIAIGITWILKKFNLKYLY